MNHLEKHIAEWCQREMSPDAKILIAVSGGVDSMVLVHLLKAHFPNLQLAHANFQLRGDESAADEVFVQEFAQKNGLTLHWRRFSPEELTDQSEESVQMWARRKRYDWFESVVRSEKIQHLLTAHHRDDQLETIWWNLMRGTGVSGLRGMLHDQEWAGQTKGLIRPLLKIGKQDILKYASHYSVPYREDSSNASLKYQRNKLRNVVLPEAMNMQPALSENSTSFADRMRDLEAILNKRISELKERVVHEKENWIEIDSEPIQSSEAPATLWHELLRPYGFTALKDIIRAVSEASVGARFFSEQYRLTVDRGKVVVDRRTDEEHSQYLWEQEEPLNKPLVLRAEIKSRREMDIPNHPDKAALDFDLLQFPLMLRRWRPGDVFKPLGMTGTKKLQDFFTDEKWSRTAKENAWLLCSGNHIVWLVGHRIDDRYKIGDATEKAYLVSLLKNELEN